MDDQENIPLPIWSDDGLKMWIISGGIALGYDLTRPYDWSTSVPMDEVDLNSIPGFKQV